LVGDLLILDVQVDEEDDRADHEQYGGQCQRCLDRGDLTRAANDCRVTFWRHSAPSRYPVPWTVRTIPRPSLRRR
jgi:hypothetical protein